MNNTLQDLHNSVDDGLLCGYVLFGRWRCNSNSTSCSLSTGSPSSKYEHWRTSALLHNIRNMRICMAKKPFIFVGYGSDRSFCHTNPYISNVTRQCRCSRGTQREYSSKPLKHSIVERILVFKR